MNLYAELNEALDAYNSWSLDYCSCDACRRPRAQLRVDVWKTLLKAAETNSQRRVQSKQTREQEMLERYGLKAFGRHFCPRWVAGKRHKWSGDCECDQLDHPLYDHVKSWRDGYGHPVLTLEPYGYDDEDLAALQSVCEGLGLVYTKLNYSPYYPGQTTLFLIERSWWSAP